MKVRLYKKDIEELIRKEYKEFEKFKLSWFEYGVNENSDFFIELNSEKE
jgi:hypothetical protein